MQRAGQIDVAHVCWLHSHLLVCTVCIDQQLDGHAIGVGLSTSPGPDWLKDVVPQLGVRLKVHQALRQAMQCNTEIDMVS